MSPPRQIAPASEFVLHDLRQNVLVQYEVRHQHQGLEPSVIFAQLSELTQLRHAQIAVFLLPDVERRPRLSPTADTHPSPPCRPRPASEHENLLIGKPRPLHRPLT
jgi:hypothetical protein